MYDHAGQQHSLERERPSRNCAVDLVLKYGNSPEGQRDEFTQTEDTACTESSRKGAQESTRWEQGQGRPESGCEKGD